MKTITFLTVAAIGMSSIPRNAAADAEEWRLSISAGGALSRMDIGGTTATIFVPGGQARVAYGLTNSLELGLHIGVGSRPSLGVSGASLDGQDGILYGDLYVGESFVDIRWYAGIGVARCFERLHPFLGVGGGVLGRYLREPALYDEAGALIVGEPPQISAVPIVAIEVGADYRFGRTFAAGVELTASAAGRTEQLVNLTIVASWRWY
jgi:hypothetical protein